MYPSISVTLSNTISIKKCNLASFAQILENPCISIFSHVWPQRKCQGELFANFHPQCCWLAQISPGPIGFLTWWYIPPITCNICEWQRVSWLWSILVIQQSDLKLSISTQDMICITMWVGYLCGILINTMHWRVSAARFNWKFNFSVIGHH